MARYKIVRTMKMKACKVITRMWKIAQGTDSSHCAQNGSSAIRMKIISPAYMLPNSRSARDTGLASSLV